MCTTKFNVYKFYFLPTQCIYVFYIDLRTNSDCFAIRCCDADSSLHIHLR
jgi:hypothetical protein